MKSDPIENLRTYIMVHNGIDRHERIKDVEWIEDALKVAKRLADTSVIMPHHIEDLRMALDRRRV